MAKIIGQLTEKIGQLNEDIGDLKEEAVELKVGFGIEQLRNTNDENLHQINLVKINFCLCSISVL